MLDSEAVIIVMVVMVVVTNKKGLLTLYWATENRVGPLPSTMSVATRGWAGFCLFVFVYFFEREHSCEQGRGRGTEDLKRALCWPQRAQCGAQTHKPWDHDLSLCRMLNWLNHPGAPGLKFLIAATVVILPSNVSITVHTRPASWHSIINHFHTFERSQKNISLLKGSWKY